MGSDAYGQSMALVAYQAPAAMPQMYQQPMPQMPQMPQMYQQQAYGQMGYPQMMPQQPQMMPQAIGQMGYPQMNQQGYMATGYAPSTMPPGFPEPQFHKKKQHWEQFSYLDDGARLQGWVLDQLARVFHERNKALKICIPTAAFAAFFVIISVVMLLDSTSGEVDATLRTCKVLITRVVEMKGGQTSRRYRPTVHVSVAGRNGEKAATRFRNAGDWEVSTEKEAWAYLNTFCNLCDVPCYEFDDGAIQLDSAEYTSVWSYIILIIFLLSAFICCCFWVASGTFACCSPLVTVTIQA